MATQRVAVSTVCFGLLAVRTVAVYGYPANHVDALEKNQELFSAVFSYLAPIRGPVLVGGDFNCDVTALPCWAAYQSAGYHELHQLQAARFGVKLPNTCRGATAWDSSSTRSLAKNLAAAFELWNESGKEQSTTPLQASDSVTPRSSPGSGLPRSYRGRCKPRSRAFVPVPASAPPGRQGDFNPPEEAVSVVARQKTRQVRRVETLVRSMASYVAKGCLPDSRASLLAQWSAICRAGGYPPNFRLWTLRLAHFTFFPVELPAKSPRSKHSPSRKSSASIWRTIMVMALPRTIAHIHRLFSGRWLF